MLESKSQKKKMLESKTVFNLKYTHNSKYNIFIATREKRKTNFDDPIRKPSDSWI